MFSFSTTAESVLLTAMKVLCIILLLMDSSNIADETNEFWASFIVVITNAKFVSMHFLQIRSEKSL